MGAPHSYDEYLQRFHANQRVEGFGLDVRMHVPCPFCAAPDWLVHEVLLTQDAMADGAVCVECGRGAKAVFSAVNGNTFIEIVQTTGMPQPEWLIPRLRDLRHQLQ